MKHCILLFVAILFLNPLFSENLPERFSLNLKLSSPLLNSDVPQLKLFVDPGMEAMYHFSLYRSVRLGAGIGCQFGNHIWNKHVEELIWVNGLGWRPWEFDYVYHFKFISVEIPVTVEFPLRGSFLSSFTVGVNFGWHSNIDFSIERTTLAKEPGFNRFYIEPNIGLRIPLKKLNKFSLSLQPFVSKWFYTTDKNDWQKNFFFVGYRLSTNFK